ncbi:unnamed protein product, partial [Protopolystoma xenopodis]
MILANNSYMVTLYLYLPALLSGQSSLPSYKRPPRWKRHLPLPLYRLLVSSANSPSVGCAPPIMASFDGNNRQPLSASLPLGSTSFSSVSSSPNVTYSSSRNGLLRSLLNRPSRGTRQHWLANSFPRGNRKVSSPD